jgi:hypothetical protein
MSSRGTRPINRSWQALEALMSSEYCEICGCKVHRRGGYAKPTVNGRSHRSKHHYVPERFLGRSGNRRGEQRSPLFKSSPWGLEDKFGVFCYDCHEELLHNPVLLPDDIKALSELVKHRRLDEVVKTKSREKLAKRIRLFQEALTLGIHELLRREHL